MEGMFFHCFKKSLEFQVNFQKAELFHVVGLII